MKNILMLVAAGVIFLVSCSKKTTPNETVQVYNTTGSGSGTISKTDSAAVVKKAAPKPKPVIPKVIMVNDAYAKKTVDGRFYYDARGKRYWKNFKDGKYYLYNKSMYTDDAFKAPKN